MVTAYVLGVDPSLTGTGVARITEDGAVAVRHFGRKGRRNETLAERRERIGTVTSEALAFGLQFVPYHCDVVPVPVLAVIEAPSHGSVGGSAWDRAHLWWSLVEGIGPHLVATVAPTTRARWATGRGRADKAAVAVAVSRLWSDADFDLDCDNCADALALAAIGAQHLGWQAPTLARHRDALAAVHWPEAVPA